MTKSDVSRETRIAAGIVAVCAVACILYSRAASRVGVAGLVTYAVSAASMVFGGFAPRWRLLCFGRNGLA